MATKYDLTNKRVGKLVVKSLVPKEERTDGYRGNLWYCDCDCGNKDIMVRTCYLTGNGNYTQTSCGCDRKLRAFLATTDNNIVKEEFVNRFDNLEKYLFVHRAVRNVSGQIMSLYTQEEYEETMSYLYNSEQFQKLYDFWQQENRSKTFYDYAKPSLDHIVPKSKGGTNHYTNLQFLTVFENLAKRDMDWEEWQEFKKQTHTISDYFIDNIMKVDNDE